MAAGRSTRTAALGAAVLLSLWVLFAPDPGGPAVGVAGLDKVVHLLLFALLGATAAWRDGRRPAVLVALAGYAVLSEVVQGLLLADRSGDPRDVLADLVGAALGVLLVTGLHTRTGGRPDPRGADLPR